MSGKLSVVIATLGGQVLYGTVKSLNEGTVVPDEILLCVPEENAHAIPNFMYSNVSILKTPFRGQVRQRAFGLGKAKCSYIMQFDDDLVVEPNSIEIMLRNLNTLPVNSCIAPSLMVFSTGESFYKQPTESVIFKLYYFLLNGKIGYKSGTITLAGTNIGVDPAFFSENLTESQWLPGGCILHRKENIITDNYYPFKGKAFCEDLYHSSLLQRNGVRMFFSNNAFVWLADTEKLSLKFRINNFISDFYSRKYFLSNHTVRKSFFRMYLYYLINMFRLFRN
jgi:hypothetical protein